jgi:hypothetical protein
MQPFFALREKPASAAFAKATARLADAGYSITRPILSLILFEASLFE